MNTIPVFAKRRLFIAQNNPKSSIKMRYGGHADKEHKLDFNQTWYTEIVGYTEKETTFKQNIRKIILFKSDKKKYIRAIQYFKTIEEDVYVIYRKRIPNKKIINTYFTQVYSSKKIKVYELK